MAAEVAVPEQSHPGSTDASDSPQPTPDHVRRARQRFVASIIAAAETRDVLAAERDAAANARDVAAALDELVRLGESDKPAERAREFAAEDRRASRGDRSAAASDRASLLDGIESNDQSKPD